MHFTDEQFTLLHNWLMTWRQRQGYGGFVTHYWGNSLRYIGPAVTQHVGIINGYMHLFEATDDVKWLKEAKVVARHLLNLQDPSLFYSFKYSGLETNSRIFSRVRSLLTNSWADSALLRLVIKLEETNDPDREYFKRGVYRNVKCFLLRTLWDPYKKRFFSNFEVSIRNIKRYYSPNKNCVALEALSLFSEVSQDYSIFEDYCLPICDWVSNDLVVNSNDSRRGAILQEPLGIGGNVYSVYNAICLRGFYEMYKVTHERRWLSVAEGISEFLLRNIDKDCGAFYSHYDAMGRLHKYPYLIAPQSIVVLSLLDLKKTGFRNMSRSVKWILKKQTAIGGFPTFYSPRKKKKLFFEDVALSTAWNGFVFELLALLSKYSQGEPLITKVPKKSYSVEFYDALNKKNIYLENSSSVNVFHVHENHKLIYSADKRGFHTYVRPYPFFTDYTIDLRHFLYMIKQHLKKE